ncbi:hypothetical protein [Akkermansia sp.]
MNKIGVVFLYYVGNELILNIHATCFPLSGCRPEARKATPEFLLGISFKRGAAGRHLTGGAFLLE